MDLQSELPIYVQGRTSGENRTMAQFFCSYPPSCQRSPLSLSSSSWCSLTLLLLEAAWVLIKNVCKVLWQPQDKAAVDTPRIWIFFCFPCVSHELYFNVNYSHSHTDSASDAMKTFSLIIGLSWAEVICLALNKDVFLLPQVPLSGIPTVSNPLRLRRSSG